MNMAGPNDFSRTVDGYTGDGLPHVPQNWYIAASSRSVRSGKIAVCQIGGTELVLFRSEESKTVTAFSAHCAHMGCHLKHACVVGENLRCALHYRYISPQGEFLKPDGSASKNLAQKRYRTDERYGVVFVYLGDDSDQLPPVPDIVQPGEFVAQYAGSFRCDTPWQALIANGCDMEHLLAVHDRRLKEDAVVTYPEPHIYKIAYNTAVTGTSLADRVMKWMSGDDIVASMTVISGTTIMVQSLAGPSPSIFILSMLPTKDGGTLVHGVVGLKADGNSFVNSAKLTFTKWLFKSFLKKDFGIFDRIDWHPPTDKNTSGDGFSMQLHEYFKALKPVRSDDDQICIQRPAVKIDGC